MAPASPRRRRLIRRILLSLLGLGGLGFGSLCGADRWVEAGGLPIVAAPDAPSAPVVIVFGAGVRGERLTAVLEDRLRVAVDLYRAGKARKLLLSGDHGRAAYDEVTAMARRAEALGVPPEDLFLDHAGFDTYATIVRAKEVFGVREALLVSQRFHLPRAVYLGRRMGLQVTGVPADLRPYARARWYALREWGARWKAVWQAEVTRPRPRFLGPPISLEGDGRVTRG